MIRLPGIKDCTFHVPEYVLKNDELSTWMDTSDEWIVSHTGIRKRHIAAWDEASSDLAVQAAKKVLQKNAISPEEIDLIILATATPDFASFPATACIVQHELGCVNAAAFDITAACSGFLYGLEIAHSMLCAKPKYQNALVIGAEVFSKIVNWEERSTCVLFGDGAGAALLTRDEQAIQVLDTLLKSDGSGAKKLWVPCGGSRNPSPRHPESASSQKITQKITQEKLAKAHSYYENDKELSGYLEMDGRGVYNFAVAANQEILHEILERNNLKVENLRYILPHQANLRIIQAVAKRENIPLERFYTNIESYANTSAASIPIALSELLEGGEMKKGDLVLCIGFGAGLTYAGALLQWGEPKS